MFSNWFKLIINYTYDEPEITRPKMRHQLIPFEIKYM